MALWLNASTESKLSILPPERKSSNTVTVKVHAEDGESTVKALIKDAKNHSYTIGNLTHLCSKEALKEIPGYAASTEDDEKENPTTPNAANKREHRDGAPIIRPIKETKFYTHNSKKDHICTSSDAPRLPKLSPIICAHETSRI